MKPVCPYFRKCSGCSVMQFPYVKQLRDKDLAVAKILAPLLKNASTGALARIVPSPDPLGYRTSSKLVLGEDDFGQERIGLFERGSKDVVAIERCPVHHPLVNDLLGRITGPRAPSWPAPFYNHGRRAFQKGCLKYLTVRVSPSNHQAAVILSHTGVPGDALQSWAKALKLPHVALYEAPIEAADGDLVLPHRVRHLAGPKTVPFVLGSMEIELSPMAFFQANYSLTADFIKEAVAAARGDWLLDLYGGFGAYSFHCQENFRRITLLDANPYATQAAQGYAAARKMSHIESIAATVEAFLGETRLNLTDVSHVIVNPPRSGLSSAARRLMSERLTGLQGMTYISCQPESLVRDLTDLTSRLGLRVKRIVPFDMFPQTGHIEVVAHLEKMSKRAPGRHVTPTPGSRPPSRKNAPSKYSPPPRRRSGRSKRTRDS